MSVIAAKVRKVVAEELGVDESTVSTDSVFEELGADSIDRMELSLAIETEFAIELPDADASKMRTVGELIDYVSARAATV